eukprot:Skav222369  [mRNA]  locus=scaffold2692:170163:172041:+ [translate_table: standard]
MSRCSWGSRRSGASTATASTAAIATGRPQRKPPRRPGVDDDERFQNLQDDPRYFPGAQLGKAQRAALGEVLSAGPNTVSYSPSSTLVEPSIRFICAESGSKSFAGFAGSDDIIAVPDFFCTVGQADLYDARPMDCHSNGISSCAKESVLAELRRMVDGETSGFPNYEEIMARIRECHSQHTITVDCTLSYWRALESKGRKVLSKGNRKQEKEIAEYGCSVWWIVLHCAG